MTERVHVPDLFRWAIEASPTGMIVSDRDGKILFVNRQIAKLFGYTVDELMNQSVEVLVPAALRERHHRLRASYSETPVARPMGACRDLMGRKKDGTEIPVEVGLNPLMTPGVELFLASVLDISERKASEQALEKQRQDLERRAKEREVLLKEVYHRVKNNLQVVVSLLSLQARKVQDVATLSLFEESANRVRAIALVHEQLYQSDDLAEVDFGEYLGKLIPWLVSGLGRDGDLQASVVAAPLRLPVDLAIPAGLITTELVTNALRHAFPAPRRGAIRVAVEEPKKGQIVLLVADDGIGLPPGLDLERGGSLGLELVRRLSKQIRGQLEVQREGGTSFRLTFRTGGEG